MDGAGRLRAAPLILAAGEGLDARRPDGVGPFADTILGPPERDSITGGGGMKCEYKGRTDFFFLNLLLKEI